MRNEYRYQVVNIIIAVITGLPMAISGHVVLVNYDCNSRVTTPQKRKCFICNRNGWVLIKWLLMRNASKLCWTGSVTLLRASFYIFRFFSTPKRPWYTFTYKILLFSSDKFGHDYYPSGPLLEKTPLMSKL